MRQKKTHISSKQNKFEPKEIFLSRQPSQAIQPQLQRQQSQQYQQHPLEISIFIPNIQKSYQLGTVYVKITDDLNIYVADLVEQLRRRDEFKQHLQNGSISIQREDNNLSSNKVYQFIGQCPLPQDALFKLQNQEKLEVKIQSTCSSFLDQITDLNEETEKNDKSRQSKQRTLAEVVERVALWRRLYSGFYDQNKQFIQMPLDKAADRVHIQKKTLDDYLLQIRYGKRYGFDFNKYQKEGISKLRQFVKSKRDKNSKVDT
ncbi:hypothetical protein pb186bvf_005954 [Paramecium bursaria]